MEITELIEYMQAEKKIREVSFLNMKTKLDK